MPRPDPPAGMPMRLRAPLLGCAAGERPPNIALMQLIEAASARGEVDAALQQTAEECPAGGVEAARLQAVCRLWTETPQAWDVLRAVLAEVGNTDPAADGIRRWSTIFDRLAAIAPEAGVALYSLGRCDLLDAATAEIVARMREWGCLGAGRILLEIGCGSGRFLPLLAREVGLVVGTDISLGMLREARRQAPSAALLRGSGCDLAAFRDASIDTVYAVDVFPYLVMAGAQTVASHFTDAFRLLRPGGQFLIFNYSYGGNPPADRTEVRCQAEAAGFAVLQLGGSGLQYWDGQIFRLHKP